MIAFDVYPKGTPNNFSNNTGVAWFDLCSNDVNLSGSNYECLRMGKFANGDAHISSAKGGTGSVRNLDLQINGGRVGIGTTSPAALLSVGSSSPFQVDTKGNITRLNNAVTNFPAVNARGYLTNDGNGNFSYTPIPSSSSAASTYTAASLPVAAAVGSVAQVAGGNSISDCSAGSTSSSRPRALVRSCEWDGTAWRFLPTGGYVLSAQPGEIAPALTSFAAPGMSSVSPNENLRQYVVARACQITKQKVPASNRHSLRQEDGQHAAS